MIKNLFCFMAMLLCVAFTSAETYKAAVINLKNGDTYNYMLDGVSISANKKYVVVESNAANAQWPLAEVESFSVAEIESISTSTTDGKSFFISFDSQSNLLEVVNYSGYIDFLLPGGQLRKSIRVNQRASIDLNDLPQSAYICVFRGNGKILKIITK